MCTSTSPQRYCKRTPTGARRISHSGDSDTNAPRPASSACHAREKNTGPRASAEGRGVLDSLGADAAKPGLLPRPPRCTRAAIQASRRVPQTRVGGMSDIILYMHRAARRNPGPVPHGLTPSTRKALSARPDGPCSAEMPRLPPSLASAYPDVSLAGIPHRRWPWQSSAIRLRRLAVIRYCTDGVGRRTCAQLPRSDSTGVAIVGLFTVVRPRLTESFFDPPPRDFYIYKAPPPPPPPPRVQHWLPHVSYPSKCFRLSNVCWYCLVFNFPQP